MPARRSATRRRGGPRRCTCCPRPASDDDNAVRIVGPTAEALAFRRRKAGQPRTAGITGGERLPTRLPEAKELRRVAAVSSPSPFGQNEWLVEEMYRKFREDPSSVDPSWHEFLVDYSPEPTTEAQPTAGNGQLAGQLAGQPPGQPAAATAPAAAPGPAPAK